MTKTATKSAKAAPAKAAPAKAAPAKAAPANPDAIAKITDTPLPQTDTIIVAAGGQKVQVDQAKVTAALQKLLVVGGSFKAVQDYLIKQGRTPAALARGVGGRDAPHSAKAIADARTGERPAKGERGLPAPKAPRSKADSDDQRAIKPTAKGAERIASKAETNAVRELTTMVKAGTVSKAIAAGLGMAAINYAVKTGTITLG